MTFNLPTFTEIFTSRKNSFVAGSANTEKNVMNKTKVHKYLRIVVTFAKVAFIVVLQMKFSK